MVRIACTIGRMENAKNILVTGARAPVALHIARLLGGAEKHVFMADTHPSPIAQASIHCADFIKLPSPRFDFHNFQDELQNVINKFKIDLVIPTSEDVFYVAKAAPMLGAKVFCPDLETLAEVHNKFEFTKMVARFGLTAPQTQILTDKSEVQNVAKQARKLVFKPVWSRFASEVLIKPTEKKLAKISPSNNAPWIAQEFIQGQELCVYAIAHKGTVFALSAYSSHYRAGLGAGICFTAVKHKQVTEFVEKFVHKSNWTGQISFDLILDETGKLLPIECNPRATSGVHFLGDGPEFWQAITAQKPIEPDHRKKLASHLAMWVFAFPKALSHFKLGAFFRHLHQSSDILDWPNDPKPKSQQIKAVWYYAKLAFKKRRSLQVVSTEDIEWNGPFS